MQQVMLIVTRTDRRGARVVAKLGVNPRKRVAVPYNHAKAAADNHWAAARALADRLGLANLGFDPVVVSPRDFGFVAW